jgi:hypothetical protein
MNLNPVQETFGRDDQSWLGSEHGTSSGRSVTLDLSTFTKNTHYPNGYLPSGTPLGKITASGKYGIYDHTTPATDGRQTLVGFLLTPVRVVVYGSGATEADAEGALLDHGRIVEANLPLGAVASQGHTDVAGRIWFV